MEVLPTDFSASTPSTTPSTSVSDLTAPSFVQDHTAELNQRIADIYAHEGLIQSQRQPPSVLFNEGFAVPTGPAPRRPTEACLGISTESAPVQTQQPPQLQPQPTVSQQPIPEDEPLDLSLGPPLLTPQGQPSSDSLVNTMAFETLALDWFHRFNEMARQNPREIPAPFGRAFAGSFPEFRTFLHRWFTEVEVDRTNHNRLMRQRRAMRRRYATPRRR